MKSQGKQPYIQEFRCKTTGFTRKEQKIDRTLKKSDEKLLYLPGKPRKTAVNWRNQM